MRAAVVTFTLPPGVRREGGHPAALNGAVLTLYAPPGGCQHRSSRGSRRACSPQLSSPARPPLRGQQTGVMPGEGQSPRLCPPGMTLSGHRAGATGTTGGLRAPDGPQAAGRPGPPAPARYTGQQDGRGPRNSAVPGSQRGHPQRWPAWVRTARTDAAGAPFPFCITASPIRFSLAVGTSDSRQDDAGAGMLVADGSVAGVPVAGAVGVVVSAGVVGGAVGDCHSGCPECQSL